MNRTNFLFSSLILLLTPSLLLAKLNVVTTTSDLAAIAREVGGDHTDALSIAQGYQDPHFVDAKPSYLLKLKRADLYIQIGLELEVGWAPSLLSNARNPKILPNSPGYLDTSSYVEVLDKPSGHIDRSAGDVHPFGNPHYWLDPENGRQIARAIATKLSELDGANATDYAANLAAFENKLTAKEKEWDAIAAPLKGTKVVFYHSGWSNFSKRFGLQTVDYVEPKPGIPPSPAHIQQLTNEMKAAHVPVILIEPYFDTKLPQKVADDTGAKLVVFPPSVGGAKGINTYLDLFDYDLKELSAALKGAVQ